MLPDQNQRPINIVQKTVAKSRFLTLQIKCGRQHFLAHRTRDKKRRVRRAAITTALTLGPSPGGRGRTKPFSRR